MTSTGSRRARTRERLQSVALGLFEAQGYDSTTVAQIAAAAEVTEMTFFRHFAAKERVVVDDPYDPLLGKAVAAQPREVPPLRRALAGFRAAVAALPDDDELLRRKVRIASRTPSLRSAVLGSTQATEDVVVGALREGGASEPAARVAAAALLAGLGAALLAWAETEKVTLREALVAAMDVLEASNA
ncbi:TetR/AcrR family transcriptional regulator [Sinomonas sp. JGH33]|uniref:TetR/AcrR family transcriptional regulator n=1 Tax=Sinomonas terricola TaxID=3110330 RepID=A0ABU5T6P4_9MICC|nr:TetR/AcrR family transcriptional regulator [Sinomonas sp. JGH33]MEA5455141.1 TetR/AcrR family transcriptional regulator [Sinomonas sp. JGH33]